MEGSRTGKQDEEGYKVGSRRERENQVGKRLGKM